jgi:hypothetical protein
MSFLNTKVVLFVVVVLTVAAVWLLLIKKKKKPGVAVTDGPPSPITDISVQSAGNGDDDDKGPVSYYTGSASLLNRRGLVVSFKTPQTSGIIGDRKIKLYNIYLFDAADQSPNPPTFLIDGVSTPFVKFPVGPPDSVAGKYEWNTDKNGKLAGRLDAEIFIEADMLKTLVQGKSYKIGISAVNSKDIASAPVFSATPIVYDKCAVGETTGCGWGDGTGISTETAVARTILNPLTCITDGPKYKLLANPAGVNAYYFGEGTWGNCPITSCVAGFVGTTCTLSSSASIATSSILGGTVRTTLIQPAVSAVILTSWQGTLSSSVEYLLLYDSNIKVVLWRYNGTSWGYFMYLGAISITIGAVNSALISFGTYNFNGTALNTSTTNILTSTPTSKDVTTNYKRLVLSSSGKLYYQLFSSASAPTAASPNPTWQCYIDMTGSEGIRAQMPAWSAYSAII